MDYLLGLDNGGTLSKAAIFTTHGREVGSAARQAKLLTPHPGHAERDMEELWQANCACVREVLEKTGVSLSDIAGISIAGHGKGLYPVKEDGSPACNGIVSTDNRAWRYPEKWKKDGVLDALYPQLCQEILSCQPVSLLAWMKDCQPDVYHNIKWAFSVKDYIRFCLTGEAFNEVTDISGTGLLDIRKAAVDVNMLRTFGIEEAAQKIAPLKYSSERCGRVTRHAAKETGLPEGIPVAGGMFDIDACAIAMDITSPEFLCTITGTWSINEYISREPVVNGSVRMNSLYAIPGYYLVEESSPTGVGNLEWVLENLLGKKPPAGARLYDWADAWVNQIQAKDCEVYFLPFLNGSNKHPLGKGSLVGLTSFHTTGHMLRAVYEGAAYAHRQHIDKLTAARAETNAIRMAGGAVNSPMWVQMFSDILGYPIETINGVKELGAMGAAMSAGIAAGVFADYPDAAKAMVTIGIV